MLVNIFLYNPKTWEVVLVQKLNKPNGLFALPGGRCEEELPDADLFDPEISREATEKIYSVAYKTLLREIAEEVGPNVTRAIRRLAQKNGGSDQLNCVAIKISGKSGSYYPQIVYLIPFRGKLRKEGMVERNEAGKIIEKLGPPIGFPMSDLGYGDVLLDTDEKFPISALHLNAIHQLMNAFRDENLKFATTANLTAKFAFDD